MKYVNEFFALDEIGLEELYKLTPEFGYDGFGEIVFYRTYSRIRSDGKQESWHDVVVRVINGVMSIRKDWYLKNWVEWVEDYWQKYALGMAISMFKMEWLPAGRGLWAMGTPFIFERGGMALNNCGFTLLGGNDRLSDDFHWMMDALMLGVGVGFEALRDDLKVYRPVGSFDHFVQDSREGWIESIKLLIDSYTKQHHRKPRFIYDLVRAKGLPINGFGGLASGPEPLKQLHDDISALFETQGIDVVRLKTDIANKIGVCVVSGNVRRSAELAMGNVRDQVFLDLKDYEKYPEREDFGGMSNNSVRLYDDSEFELLGEVARRVIVRGEPGVLNLRNFPKGRVGKPIPVREDKAIGINPCGEIPLEDKELCNVVETLPTMCANADVWYKACEYATFYASSVSLLPTHRSETNQVVVRNRRIGVGIIDWTGWVHRDGLHKVTAYMRRGYDVVTQVNQQRNGEAGVPESIRKTTIKPGGTGPKLPGKTSGIGNPSFDYTLRLIRVAANNPICPVLDAAGVPSDPDYWDPTGTRVYKYPTLQGPAEPAENVTLWEQAMNLVTVQREWSDNAVSNTLYFRPKWKLILVRDTFATTELKRERQFRTEFRAEVRAILDKMHCQHIKVDKLFDKVGPIKMDHDFMKLSVKLTKYGEWELKVWEHDPHNEEHDIEKVISAITPLTKSFSLLPHTPQGAYRQMPEQGITKAEYEERKSRLKKIDWSLFGNSDGMDEKYCSGDACVIPGAI